MVFQCDGGSAYPSTRPFVGCRRSAIPDTIKLLEHFAKLTRHLLPIGDILKSSKLTCWELAPCRNLSSLLYYTRLHQTKSAFLILFIRHTHVRFVVPKLPMIFTSFHMVSESSRTAIQVNLYQEVRFFI